MKTYFIFVMALLLVLGNPFFPAMGDGAAVKKESTIMQEKPERYPVAVFAGGCFWCVESDYRSVHGVLYTRVGYTGGHVDNPTYEDTHDSKSGHAEAVEITFDPAQVSFRDPVEYFLTEEHDPTQLNRQDPDTGTQYRSAIFYQDEAQKKTAQEVIDDVTARKIYDKPIVTTLEPAATFWEAESYHQQYYEKYEARTGQKHINDLLGRQKRKP